jgi:hydrogenase nickel incorporation protein HypA/HybF
VRAETAIDTVTLGSLELQNMHEFSICESVLGIIEDNAKAQDFNRVRRVRLEIGLLSGVEVEALRFSFDAVTRETLAEGAVLEIVEKEAIGLCLDCKRSITVQDRLATCPHCGGFHLQITGGKELRIIDLEVE